jgi:hypothetical protein
MHSKCMSMWLRSRTTAAWDTVKPMTAGDKHFNRRSRRDSGVSFSSRILLSGLSIVFFGCAAESKKQVSSDSPQDSVTGTVQRGEKAANVGSIDAAAFVEDEAALRLSSSDWIQKIGEVADGRTPTLQHAEPAGPALDLLAAKRQLEDLLLDAGGTTDTSIETISRLEKLTHLRIRLDRLSDAAALALVGTGERTPVVETLQILNWPHSALSAVGIRELAKLKRLRQLRLGGDSLDDEAAKELAKLPELRSLHVIRPQFTAEALEYLAAAPKLTSLYIDECPLPDEAWESLFAAKPRLHVHIDQAHHDLDPSSHP